jgi:ATP-dependent DNA helicase RecG
VLAVYRATEGLSFKVIRGLLEKHLDSLLPLVKEYLPAELLAQAGVPALPEAMRQLHRPTSVAAAHTARARLAFEELLFVHLLQRRAHELAKQARDGIRFVNRKELTSRFREVLPFELTKAQVRAVR